jgi:hypothetical protein
MELDQQLRDAVGGENYLVQDGDETSIVDNGYDSDPYEDNEDNPEGKDHDVGQRQSHVSNNAAYGTVMQLTEVAFDLPVEPKVSGEILTHALQNTAEPAAPVPIEPPRRVSPWSVPWVETPHEHLATTSTSPGAHPDEDCTNWLSDKDIEHDNLAPQDPVS